MHCQLTPSAKLSAVDLSWWGQLICKGLAEFKSCRKVAEGEITTIIRSWGEKHCFFSHSIQCSKQERRSFWFELYGLPFRMQQKHIETMQTKSSQGAFKKGGKRFLPTKRLLDGSAHRYNRDMQAYSLQASWCEFNRWVSLVIGPVRFVRFRLCAETSWVAALLVLGIPDCHRFSAQDVVGAFLTWLIDSSKIWAQVQNDMVEAHDYSTHATNKTNYLQIFWTKCKVAESSLVSVKFG